MTITGNTANCIYNGLATFDYLLNKVDFPTLGLPTMATIALIYVILWGKGNISYALTKVLAIIETKLQWFLWSNSNFINRDSTTHLIGNY